MTCGEEDCDPPGYLWLVVLSMGLMFLPTVVVLWQVWTSRLARERRGRAVRRDVVAALTLPRPRAPQ